MSYYFLFSGDNVTVCFSVVRAEDDERVSIGTDDVPTEVESVVADEDGGQLDVIDKADDGSHNLGFKPAFTDDKKGKDEKR